MEKKIKFFAAILTAVFCISGNLLAYFDGDGTPENPYQIADVNNFQQLSSTPADCNKCFVLTANINLGDLTFVQSPIAPDTDNTQANGFQGTKFTGVFDGDGHIIFNLDINQPENDYIGLFGYVGENGRICNLGIEDVNTTGRKYVGGLVAYNSKGTISNCYSTGQAAGNSFSYVGGLIGFNFGGTISNCYSTVTATGAGATIGGLVGCNFTGSTISNCSASGVITDTDHNDFDSCAGGLVGNNFASNIANCSATGNISSTSASSSSYKSIGGLVGNNGHGTTISNCYATTNIHTTSSSTTTVCGGGLVGLNSYGDVNDCYALGTVTFDCNTQSNYFFGGLAGLNAEGSVNRSYSKGLVGSSDSAQADCCVGGFTGFNMDGMVYGCFWDIETSTKALSGGGRGLTTEQMKTTSIFQNAGWADKGWFIDDGIDYPRLAWEGIGGVAIPASSVDGLLGSGTAGQPYEIWTAQDFAIWCQYASVLDKHTILMADVNLYEVVLNPIGEYGPFTGTFDGNGYIFKNLTITQPTNSHVGLFGILGTGAVVKNLGIEDANIVGGDYVSALVGRNQGGTVLNCYSTGTVTGLAYSGGLIGKNEFGTVTNCHSIVTVNSYSFTGGLIGNNYCGVVENCYSAGITTALDPNNLNPFVGGLVGENFSGTITACYATGPVSGFSYVGGLVGNGSSGTIAACYSTGSVSGSSYTGGLVGENFSGTITACYSTGSVSGSSYAGGLVGDFSGTITACYATGPVSGSSYVGGLVGKGSVGSITACYSTGLVRGSSYAGGLVGAKSSTLNACFWDTQTSGKTIGVGSGTSTGVTGKTTEEMMTPSTFALTQWDFSASDGDPADWIMLRPGEDYPRLAWQQVITGDIAGLYGVNFVDYARIAAHWGQTGCPTGCENADITNDGTVDIDDLMLFADNWLVF